MTNNDVLRRLRYALDISDREVVALFANSGYVLEIDELDTLFMKDEDEGFAECPDLMLDLFLKGLITGRRGRREVEAAERPEKNVILSNNDILKALRIALSLKDDDLLAIMELAGVKASKAEIGALFRKKGHPNFRPCGDQFLRNFLVGLTKKYRSAGA